MRAWLVALVACGTSGPGYRVVVPPAPVEPTGPELWTAAPGATELAVLGNEVLWLAPVDGGSDANGIFTRPGGVDALRLALVAIGARGFTTATHDVVWGEGSGVRRIEPGSGDPRVVAHVDGTVASIAEQGGWLAIAVDTPAGAALVRQKLGDVATTDSLDGADPIVVAGSDAFDVGTSTSLYRIDNTGALDLVLVDGGVRALAVDGDDVFAGGTIIYERAGRGRLVRLGPAGGAVTAMAVDGKYVYWATAAGDREPAIYRALRSKPERELFTQVGAAAALVVGGAYMYWLDPIEGAIHRIRR